MKRSGFTLVELAVVLGIIGTILALLAPALRGGAEAARRCQCLNNLKQLHLGLQSYHGTHSVFPPGVTDGARPLLPSVATRRAGWVTMVLPWVEQSYLYNVVNFDVDAADAANSTARRTWMSALLCPDSVPERSGWRSSWPWGRGSSAPEPEFGMSSFAACHHDVEKPIDVGDHGVLHLNSRVRAADVFDGLSHTIFLGELLAPASEGWLVGGRATLRNTGTRINGLDVAALGPVPTLPEWRSSARDAEALETLAASGRIALPEEYVGGFGSRHRGDGGNFAFGDGSVRFVRRTIDPEVYRRLGNRDDGEEASDDAY